MWMLTLQMAQNQYIVFRLKVCFSKRRPGHDVSSRETHSVNADRVGSSSKALILMPWTTETK
jgi:hypothetical protein